MNKEQNIIKGFEPMAESRNLSLYYDSEFTGLHQHTTLISVGIVAETGETFYAEAIDYDWNQINSWLRKNVVQNLTLRKLRKIESTDDHTRVRDVSDKISSELFLWLKRLSKKHNVNKFEIWSDVYTYDWMLLCQMYGGALYIPKDIYYIPFDIATEFKLKGIDPDISREEFAKGPIFACEKTQQHNALYDAQIIKMCHEKMMNMPLTYK